MWEQYENKCEKEWKIDKCAAKVMMEGEVEKGWYRVRTCFKELEGWALDAVEEWGEAQKAKIDREVRWHRDI